MKFVKSLCLAAAAAAMWAVPFQADARKNAPGPSDEVCPVYFADCFHENGLLLHFRWRADGAPYSQAVVFNEAGEVLARVPYPENKVNLPAGTEKVSVVAIDTKGRQSEAVPVDMTKTYDDLKVESLEPIRIRKGVKRAGFYLADSGREIILKGVNYCRVTTKDHDTFEPDFGPISGCYDPYDAETMFRLIRRHGYNFVRVFIKTGYRRNTTFGLSGPASTHGIWPAYMDNFIDFMRRAHSYGIYVLPCFCENEMLSNDYFKALSHGASGQGILFSTDGIKAKCRYMTLFFKYLRKNASDVLNGLAAVTMQNEFHFNVKRPPFDQMEGVYKFYDGTEYDMSDDAQRRRLANHAMDLYYKAMKKTVKKNMPGLPMGEGTFCLRAVAKTYETAFGMKPIKQVKDMRFPMTCLEYLRKDIDFLDWHIYRGNFKGAGGEVFAQAVEDMHLDTPEAQELMKVKPVILGEFGAFKEQEHTIEAARDFAQGLIDGAMDFGLKGTCYWTVDSFEQIRIWNLMHHDLYLLRHLHW